MKKILSILMLFLTSCVLAADKLHVEALKGFSSEDVEAGFNFSVKLVEDGMMNDVYMLKGDILNCVLKKVTDPTRAKRDAKIYFTVESYEDSKGVHDVQEPLVARYAKTVLNKEEIKKTPPKKIAKKAASTVGNFFMKGFSYCVSFADGFATNPEGNRLKSGAKQVYKDSFLSMVEYGKEVTVKEGDVFYLVVKPVKEEIEKETLDEQKEEVEKNQSSEEASQELTSQEDSQDAVKQEATQETQEEQKEETQPLTTSQQVEIDDGIEVVREIEK